MSHWNHRVVKKVYEDGYEEYSIRETHYNEDDSIFGYTEDPADLVAESVDDLRQYLDWCALAFDKPILVDGEVEFVNHEDLGNE